MTTDALRWRLVLVGLLAGLCMVQLAYAVLPGAVALAIPAIRTIFLNQGAIVAVGAGNAVRAVLPRVGNVAGVSVPMTAGRVISADSVAISALGVTGVTAGLITALADDVDCRVGMSLECDPLIDQTTKTVYAWRGPTHCNQQISPTGNTVHELFSAIAQGENACPAYSVGWPMTAERRYVYTAANGLRYQTDTCNVSTGQCTIGTFWSNASVFGWTQAPMLGCHPPSPGVANSDRTRCKTGNYAPATPAEAFERWKERGTPIADPVGVAREAADAGAEFPGGTVTGPSGTPTTIDAPSPIIEGPATVPLPRTDSTTTDPDGTVRQTVREPVAEVTYEGDTYRWDITTTTTTTVTPPGGSPSVTVTVETTGVAPGTPPPTPEPAPEDPVDPCSFGPDRLGCIKLGDVPGDQVPTADRSVEFEPEQLGAEGCPAPVPLGDGRTFSYQPLCDGLVSVRPLIIALGFLMAGGIMIAALRGAT